MPFAVYLIVLVLAASVSGRPQWNYPATAQTGGYGKPIPPYNNGATGYGNGATGYGNGAKGYGNGATGQSYSNGATGYGNGVGTQQGLTASLAAYRSFDNGGAF